MSCFLPNSHLYSVLLGLFGSLQNEVVSFAIICSLGVTNRFIFNFFLNRLSSVVESSCACWSSQMRFDFAQSFLFRNEFSYLSSIIITFSPCIDCWCVMDTFKIFASLSSCQPFLRGIEKLIFCLSCNLKLYQSPLINRGVDAFCILLSLTVGRIGE